MDLSSLVREELIFPALPGADGPTVLRAFAERLADAGAVEDADELYRKLWEREELGSTGIGLGVAIPHCKMDGLHEVILAVGATERDVEFGAADGKPVRLFFVLVSPEAAPAEHLKSLAAVSKWVKADRHVERLMESPSHDEIHRLLVEESNVESQA